MFVEGPSTTLNLAVRVFVCACMCERVRMSTCDFVYVIISQEQKAQKEHKEKGGRMTSVRREVESHQGRTEEHLEGAE